MGKSYSFAILSSSSTVKHVIDNILNRTRAEVVENTWRIDCERRMEMEVLNIFQRLFPQYFLEAGLQISLSDILDKKIGLGEQFFYYLVISEGAFQFYFLFLQVILLFMLCFST